MLAQTYVLSDALGCSDQAGALSANAQGIFCVSRIKPLGEATGVRFKNLARTFLSRRACDCAW